MGIPCGSFFFFFFNSHLFPAGSEFILEIKEMKQIPLLLPVRLSDFPLQRSVPSICPPAQVCVMSSSRSHRSCCLLWVFMCEPEYGDALYLNWLDPFPNGETQPQTHKLSSFLFCIVLTFLTSTQLCFASDFAVYWKLMDSFQVAARASVVCLGNKHHTLSLHSLGYTNESFCE